MVSCTPNPVDISGRRVAVWWCVIRVIQLLLFEVVSPIHGLCDRCLRERIGRVVCGRAVTVYRGRWSGHSREVRRDMPLGVVVVMVPMS